MNTPTAAEVKTLIAAELGLADVIVDETPVIHGVVSLAQFGVCGSMVVYEGDDGQLRAGPAPFGAVSKHFEAMLEKVSGA